MATVGYVTTEYATEYVSTHYTQDEQEYQLWKQLDEQAQAVYLLRAYDVINLLPLRGRKTSAEQEGAFPRMPDTEVPEVVMDAQVELALAKADTSDNESAQEYRRMVEYGIQSYSIGNFKETLLTYSKNNLQLYYGLTSTTAEKLLQPWLSGGFGICPACRNT